MKRLQQFRPIFIGIILVGVLSSLFVFAQKAQTSEKLHTVTVSWLLDVNQDCGTQPPFQGTSLIGSTSFKAVQGDSVDISHFTYNPAGASYWQEGFINYNGTPCMIEFTYGAGGKEVDSAGNPVDGLPFSFDPFGNLTIPGTDVDLYYIYTPYFDYQEPNLDSALNKIVIYVNRPNADINFEKQKYEAYEIFHVNKSQDVSEDVTNDYTVGQMMPEEKGFSYWISQEDIWFDVVKKAPYFNLINIEGSNNYNITLDEKYPNTEETAIEIAKYLENHIPKEAIPKVITADSPSYDNDPGYYLIVSDINSNLILGTTNIAITEKAEYPTIQKTVDDSQVEVGQTVTFTIEISFPKGSKAESIVTDTMTEGLTYVEDSLKANLEGAFELQLDANGWIMTFPQDVIKEAFKNKDGTLQITYEAIVNESAKMQSNGVNMNTARLDFSHYTAQDSVNLNLKEITLLKYDAEDTLKFPLPGAKFELLDSHKNTIPLSAIEEGKEYIIAEPSNPNSVKNFVTGSSTIVIKGLAADEQYYLREIEAPAGYNLYNAADVEIDNDYIEIGNTKGTVLPSTGGIGTRLFYIIGALLILSSIYFLLRKKIFDI